MPVKYYVHVHGPDDMIQKPSWNAALEYANSLNTKFAEMLSDRTDNDPIMYAVAVINGEDE